MASKISKEQLVRNFPRAEIVERLALLSNRQRTAYAAACAERLLPLYRWFQNSEAWGDINPLERGIVLVWDSVRTGNFDQEIIASSIEACEAVTPDLDHFSSSLASRALDSASSIAQALQVCTEPTCDNAADAGEIAWECAFGIEQSRLSDFDKARIVDHKLLKEAVNGSLLLLEEDLQRRSLQALAQQDLSPEVIDNFRSEFAHLES